MDGCLQLGAKVIGPGPGFKKKSKTGMTLEHVLGYSGAAKRTEQRAVVVSRGRQKMHRRRFHPPRHAQEAKRRGIGDGRVMTMSGSRRRRSTKRMGGGKEENIYDEEYGENAKDQLIFLFPPALHNPPVLSSSSS